MISSLVVAEKLADHILSWLPGKSSDFPLEASTGADFVMTQVCPSQNTEEELSSDQLTNTAASQRSGHIDLFKHCFKMPTLITMTVLPHASF